MTTTLEDVIKEAAAAARIQLDSEAQARVAHDRAMDTAGKELMKLFLGRVAAITGRMDLQLLDGNSIDGPPSDSDNLLDFIGVKSDNGRRVFYGILRAPEGTVYRARMNVDNLPVWEDAPETTVELDLGKRCCRRRVTMVVRDAVTHLAALEARQYFLAHGELPTSTRIHICEPGPFGHG